MRLTLWQWATLSLFVILLLSNVGWYCVNKANKCPVLDTTAFQRKVDSLTAVIKQKDTVIANLTAKAIAKSEELVPVLQQRDSAIQEANDAADQVSYWVKKYKAERASKTLHFPPGATIGEPAAVGEVELLPATLPSYFKIIDTACAMSDSLYIRTLYPGYGIIIDTGGSDSNFSVIVDTSIYHAECACDSLADAAQRLTYKDSILNKRLLESDSLVFQVALLKDGENDALRQQNATLKVQNKLLNDGYKEMAKNEQVQVKKKKFNFWLGAIIGALFTQGVNTGIQKLK